jgi:malate dehydrogenase (oxaloacetate-decarboxylating)
MKDLKIEALKYHEGGKFAITSKVRLDSKEDLTLAYSPGVAFASLEIANNKALSYLYTSRKNVIAVITDGTAVLGLGDIGPEAAMPVMEGKCLLFKKFAGVDAIPICLNTKDPDEIVKTIEYLAPSFGGINLEDISFPRCVEIERRLVESLDIPVFHDDQKGTAVVTTAALINACKLVNKPLNELTIALCGLGAAGSSIAKMLKKVGVKTIYAFNSRGIVSKSKNLIPEVQRLINEGIVDSFDDYKTDTLAEIMKGADVFIGVSAANIVTAEMVNQMASLPIVFALANPNPEIGLEEVKKSKAYIYATGRSDYPNQINNVLAFPGIFKGILNSGYNKITDQMCLNAAYAISNLVLDNELSPEFIIPSAFNETVVGVVASAIINTKE